MKRLNYLIAGTLVFGYLIVFLGSTEVVAQERGRGGRGNLPEHRYCRNAPDSAEMAGPVKMHRIPDLTKEQSEKMEKIQLSLHKEMLPLKNQLEEKKAHLRTLSSADKPDQAAINQTIDEISLLKASMMKKKNAAHQEIRALLTDKQRVLFDSRQGKKGKGRNGGMGGRGGW